MPRFYVEKDGEWNIFSTVVDDFLFDEFVCLDALKARLLYEQFKELTEDMDSLLTDNPRVNVMAYSEAIERKQVDTPQMEICDTCKYRSSNVFGNWCVGRDTCDRYEADTPHTETKTETQNSNLTFEKRTMRDCYNCKRYETEGECIECHYEPKIEPTISKMEQVDKDINVRSKDEPQSEEEILREQCRAFIGIVEQTDCAWK